VDIQRARIVILSATRHNPRRATFAVVPGADVPPPPVAVMVPTAEADPVRGTIDVSRLRRLAPETLRQLDRALRTYLDLR
jgi:hypothetical protein